MSREIYNKNAREKALLEEAYGNVYTEGGKIKRLFKNLFGNDKKKDDFGSDHRDPVRRKDLGLDDDAKPNVKKTEPKPKPKPEPTTPVPETIPQRLKRGALGATVLGGATVGTDMLGVGDKITGATGTADITKGTASIARDLKDGMETPWGKWAIPVGLAVGGGYLAGKIFSKDDDDEDSEEFNESKIYNKNAREKSLLEEAYASVYREDTDKEKRYEDRWDKDLDKEREKEGSSSAGDYSDVDKDDFCGPAGGAAPGTYPVNTEKRARAALSYAHNAPDPEGIKRCVYRKAKKHGWFEEPEDEENPDAHTYSNLGREPGPAAELNPNIGFDEDEEAVNENLLDKIQDGLTYVGLAPGVGVPVDLANAGISALRGKWGDAALNVGAAVPLAGWAVPGKKIGDKIVDAAKGTHMAGRSKKAKAAAFGGEVGKDLFTPEQSFMDPGIQLRDLNPANWSQPKTGAPSRAAILQGKGPKPTKQQLHAKGIPTMSPVSDEEVSVGAEVMFDGMMKSGQVEEVDLENGVAVVVDEDGGEHIVDLDNFDVVLNP